MNTQIARFDAQTKADIRHLTRSVWSTAAIVVSLIILFGVTMRVVHVTTQPRQEHVDDR